jgi:hydroxymethylpyrimidine/phosphomethylpyrimidine kinase
MVERRGPIPDDRPVALTIAGSDSGGGAGIQADLKTMAALGAVPTSAVTSVTAQHTRGVASTHVLPVEEVRAQVEAVTGDFAVRAAKTGMLATGPIVRAVAELAGEFAFPLVVDPVMVAESGDPLLETDAERAYEELLASATLATPNADEAAVLTDIEVTDPDAARRAGESILKMGADATLVTGGHVESGEDEAGTGTVVDVLVTSEGTCEFEGPRVDTGATHGSGCTLSSAIAAALAVEDADPDPEDDTLVSAVETGIEHVRRAIAHPLAVGEGPGAVNHLAPLRDRAAREPTMEAVESVVARLVEADVSPLVPEVGITVAGATPYARTPEQVAAVEGRITRTPAGVREPRGVRMDASSHVARFLLGARQFDPDLRFACNVAGDERVRRALSDLDWTVAEFDREEQPDDVRMADGSTMAWGARRAVERLETTPDAVLDAGAVGKEPMTRLLARDGDELAEKVTDLLVAVESRSE